MPGVAAAAGLMDHLKMPLREIEGKFTRSELSMMAWRSAEVAANLKLHQSQPMIEMPGAAGTDDVSSDLGSKIGPERDLRKLTGEEAMAFLGAQGWQVGST